MVPLRKYSSTLKENLIIHCKNSTIFLDELLKATVLNQMCLSFPVSVSSRLTLMRWLLAELKEIDSDAFYELYGQLSAMPENKFCYKTFLYNSKIRITML